MPDIEEYFPQMKGIGGEIVTIDASHIVGNVTNGIKPATATIASKASGFSADFYTTGNADDLQVNNAIAELGAAGGEILLLSNINISSPINLISNISIRGMGTGATTIFVQNSANMRAAFVILGTFIYNVKLRGFTIDGNKANQTAGDGIYIYTSVPTADTDNVFEDLIIKNCKQYNIEIGAHNSNGSMYFNRIHLTNAGLDGYHDPVFGLTDSVFTSVISDTNGQNGFFIGGVDNHFQDCKSFFNGSVGGSTHGFTIAGYNNAFTASEAQDNFQSGFYLDGDAGAALAPYNNQYNTFTNCLADSNGRNDAGDYGTYACGMQIVNTKGTQIVGGWYMTRPFPFGTHVQRIGISVQGTSSKTRIINPAGENNLTAFYSNTASGTGNTFFGSTEDADFGARPVFNAGGTTFEWDNTTELFWNQANPNISLYKATDNKLSIINTGGGRGSLVVQDQLQAKYITRTAQTLGASGTVSIDPTLGDVLDQTPTGATTFNAASIQTGQTLTFIIATSGTTSYVLTVGTHFVSTGTLATGTVSGKVFTVTFVSDGTNYNETSRTTAM